MWIVLLILSKSVLDNLISSKDKVRSGILQLLTASSLFCENIILLTMGLDLIKDKIGFFRFTPDT